MQAIFTFLQARLSNAFTDMKVSMQDITSATIDEALTGPTFVPEVGATRRRMNIISDIKRPENQRKYSTVVHLYTQTPCITYKRIYKILYTLALKILKTKIAVYICCFRILKNRM